MSIIVQKYGGSSVSTPELIKNVAQRIVSTKRRGVQVVVVVSAMGNTTDELISLAQRITDSPPKRELDMLISTGERIAMSLLSMAINSLGDKAISFTGSQSGIITDTSHTKAKIIHIKAERIKRELAKDKIVIVAGFQGVSYEKEITTLGRGGSDITAVALAVALSAECCEIYTDIDGVYTADPKVVPQACKLPYISYTEMMELASSGAQVVHPRAVELAAKNNIYLKVCSSFTDQPGTVIGRNESIERLVVKGIAYDKKIAMLTIRGVPKTTSYLSQIVTQLADNGISIKLFFHGLRNQRIFDLSFIVAEDDYNETLAILQQAAKELKAKKVVVDRNVGMVSAVGSGLGSNTTSLACMLDTLAELNIHVETVSTSEIKISCVIDKSFVDKAVNALHQRFNL